MSAEHSHVIVAVIRRHTRERPTIPLVTRFDPHDKLTSAPQPFLFQRVVGSRREVFSSTTVVRILGQLCAELAADHREFADAKCTPHDFRRLLGHRSMRTARETPVLLGTPDFRLGAD